MKICDFALALTSRLEELWQIITSSWSLLYLYQFMISSLFLSVHDQFFIFTGSLIRVQYFLYLGHLKNFLGTVTDSSSIHEFFMNTSWGQFISWMAWNVNDFMNFISQGLVYLSLVIITTYLVCLINAWQERRRYSKKYSNSTLFTPTLPSHWVGVMKFIISCLLTLQMLHSCIKFG